jgi:hypothetical protein
MLRFVVIILYIIKDLGIVLSPQLSVGIRYADSKLFGTSDDFASDEKRPPSWATVA